MLERAGHVRRLQEIDAQAVGLVVMGDRDRAVPAVRIAACVPCQRTRRRGVPVLARGGGVARGHAAGEALFVPFSECGDPVALGEAKVMIEMVVHHPTPHLLVLVVPFHLEATLSLW